MGRARERVNCVFDLGCVAHRAFRHLDAKQRRVLLDGRNPHPPRGIGGIVKHQHASDAWGQLLQILQPFSAGGELVLGETGDVAAGPRQAFDETGLPSLEPRAELRIRP
jgi:hypothetical protein